MKSQGDLFIFCPESITPISGNYMLDNQGNTFWVYFNSSSTFSSISGTRYVDGTPSSDVSSSTKEIIIAGITLTNDIYSTLVLMSNYIVH